MKINNATEFFHFVKNNGLSGIDLQINAFVGCMEEYSRMCPCDPAQTRAAKINKCQIIYTNFISSATQFKNIFFSKISDNVIEFYDNGRSILTLSR